VKLIRGTTQIATMSPLLKSNNFYALTRQSRKAVLTEVFPLSAPKGCVSHTSYRFTPTTGSLRGRCEDGLHHSLYFWL